MSQPPVLIEGAFQFVSEALFDLYWFSFYVVQIKAARQKVIASLEYRACRSNLAAMSADEKAEMKFHNRHYCVGEQAGETPHPEQFEAGPFRKSRPPEPVPNYVVAGE